MTSTLVVLVILPVVRFLLWRIALAACSNQAKRNGQSLKSMGWSFSRGYTAEFYPRDNPRQNRPPSEAG